MSSFVLRNNQNYSEFLDWFIQFTPIDQLWGNQPTYLIVQTSFLIGALLTLIHAFKRGGRFPYLWFATVLHGLLVEGLCYILPDVDNFWHSLAPVMFLGNRLPLHIIFLYPCFIYQASIAAANLKLPDWAEPFVVGLLVVLIDLPYDMTGVKFVHWTWHDTDPNIADRHYWVPWNSYYFHLTFAASFTFWFHTSRAMIDSNEEKWQCSRRSTEVASMIVAAVLGPLGGILLFVLIYHPLHDFYNIHSEVVFFILFSISLLIAWTGQNKSVTTMKEDIDETSPKLLQLALTIHYFTFLSLVSFHHPETEVSVGLHQPIGPCNVYQPVRTILKILKKEKFLCPTNYDEDYFDFHCVEEGHPKKETEWYTICGTPFENRVEYITILLTIIILAIGVFGNIYFSSTKCLCKMFQRQKHKTL